MQKVAVVFSGIFMLLVMGWTIFTISPWGQLAASQQHESNTLQAEFNAYKPSGKAYDEYYGTIEAPSSQIDTLYIALPDTHDIVSVTTGDRGKAVAVEYAPKRRCHHIHTVIPHTGDRRYTWETERSHFGRYVDRENGTITFNDPDNYYEQITLQGYTYTNRAVCE